MIIIKTPDMVEGSIRNIDSSTGNQYQVKTDV